MPWQEDASWKVVGLNPGASKDFFLAKSMLKCKCITIPLREKCFARIPQLISILFKHHINSERAPLQELRAVVGRQQAIHEIIIVVI